MAILDDTTTLCTQCKGSGWVLRLLISDGNDVEVANWSCEKGWTVKTQPTNAGEVTYRQHYPCSRCDTTGDSRGVQSCKKMKGLPDIRTNPWEILF